MSRLSKLVCVFAFGLLALSGLADSARACPPRVQPRGGVHSDGTFRVMAAAPGRRMPAQREEGAYVVCTQPESGGWQVKHLLRSRSLAQKVASLLQQAGERAWAMELQPVPKGISISLADGEAAIAIAISLGDDARSVAIGPNGRAEARAGN